MMLPMGSVAEDLALQESDNMEYELKIQNNFSVSDFMKQIDIDFIFAYYSDGDEYVLMNDESIGVFDEKAVNRLAKSSKRVVVITAKTLTMKVYNIDKSEVVDAIMNM